MLVCSSHEASLCEISLFSELRNYVIFSISLVSDDITKPDYHFTVEN
jgi:hypothetical protein